MKWYLVAALLGAGMTTVVAAKSGFLARVVFARHEEPRAQAGAPRASDPAALQLETTETSGDGPADATGPGDATSVVVGAAAPEAIASEPPIREQPIPVSTENEPPQPGAAAPAPTAVPQPRVLVAVAPAAAAPTPSARASAASKPGPAADVQPPSSPPALSATALLPSQVALTWLPSHDDVAVKRYEVLRDADVVASVSTTSAALRGLRADVEHCFTVVAVDGSGNRSAPAGPACARTPDTSPPTAPEDVTATATSETAIHVGWRASSDDVGVVGYELLRPEVRVASVAETQARDEQLEPLTEYCYAVVAIDRVGNRSAPGGPACARTPDETAPTRPGDVRARAVPPDAIQLEWLASKDAGGVAWYEVVLSGAGIASSRETRATVSGLSPGKSYCMSIQAWDAAGNRSLPGGPACATIPDVDPPSTPTAVIAAAGSSKRALIVWNASTDNVGVAGYELVRDGKVVETVRRAFHYDSALSPLSEYCYAVRALDAAGNRSPESPRVCTTTPDASVPESPLDVEVEAASANSVALHWSPSDGQGLAYRVYSGKERVGATAGLSFVDAGLRPSTRYCYTVVAVDAADRESPRLPPRCATTTGLLTDATDRR